MWASAARRYRLSPESGDQLVLSGGHVRHASYSLITRTSNRPPGRLTAGVVMQCPQKKLPILDLRGSVIDTVLTACH